MKLDVKIFEKAIKQLEKNICFCEAEADSEKKETFRTACIQSFEHTYEMAMKMLRRQLKEIESAEEIESMSFRNLIRTGAEKGFINAPTAWFGFRENRNRTVHAYDEAKAKEIYATLPAFIKKARFLFDRLKDYNR